MPSRKSRFGREANPEVQNWSGDPPGGPEVVGDPPGTGRETLPEVRKWSETHPVVLKWSRDPPGDPEVVGRPSWRFGTGRETHP